ncbi:MAG: hypothetical protein WA154_12240 [Moraxellaceae bacterium]
MNQKYRNALNCNTAKRQEELKLDYRKYRKAVIKANLFDLLRVSPVLLLVLVAVCFLVFWNKGIAL